ncbi:MAG: peptidoglycan DD-metalloendopeptidase family protein [Flavisolibacter sp.]|nr:peptidoglycan DD-metalloendopeptidase family protein [Flavisolibacter sp.]
MYKISFIILCAALTVASWAQPTQAKAKMEHERQAIQKEINEIQSVYKQVKGQKQETIGQLNLLQKKMVLQDRYIDNISKELRILNDDIYLSNQELNRLQQQLDTLKLQYSRSVVYAYKNRSAYDYLNFIFSANSFNDALKRIAYLKSYRAYREQQVKSIRETQQLIADRRQQLLGKKTQKNVVLQNQQQQLDVLEDQKKEKDIIVAKLKSKESELAHQIAERKKRDKQLKNAIAAVIRREIEMAKKEAARRAAEEKERRDREALANKASNAAASNANTDAAATTTKKTVKKEASYLTLNEKDVALASNFQSNRGRLPWPVDNGYVCIHYGTYQVPGTLIKGDNPGITLCTPSPGASVKAVFDGEVSAVSNLGDGMTVMIRHGKYFTIYSNLSGASVSKGTTVHTGQVIGRSGSDDEGGTGGKVDFLLMVETNNVNPEPWLRPH